MQAKFSAHHRCHGDPIFRCEYIADVFSSVQTQEDDDQGQGRKWNVNTQKQRNFGLWVDVVGDMSVYCSDTSHVV